MKRKLDERQSLLENKSLIRTFAFFLLLMITFVIILSFKEFSSLETQLSLIGIIFLSYIYMIIDSFYIKTIYPEVADKKDVNKKMRSGLLYALLINIFVWMLSYFGKIDVEITLINIFILFAISLFILCVYCIFLHIWIKWYDN